MQRRTFVCTLAVLAALAGIPERAPAAANKELQELQRDVAQLQDQLKQMQQSQDRQLTEIRTLVQQALSSSTDANKSVAVIQSSLQQSLRDQESKVVTPVVGLASRMDQVSTDVRTLQQAMADLTNFLSKMGAQLDDLKREIKVIQAPPAPPPPGTATTTPGTQQENPPMPASDLYANALRDQRSGKSELALQEFSDYLKYYGATDMAPNAQYYIASIHMTLGEYQTAANEFDMVVEKYPENNKTPDAMYGKAQAILKMGRRTDAAREFEALANRFPRNVLAAQACAQVVSLGFNCNAPAGNAKSSPKKGKKG
jgi:TolA-binding protein